MTVGDLIEHLQSYPKHCNVVMFNADYNEILTIDNLSYYESDNGLIKEHIVELFATGDSYE